MLRYSGFLVICAVLAGVQGEKASCTISGSGGVKGQLTFTAGSHHDILVEGHIEGLTPGKHGFHIHQYGDLSNGCASMAGHFNPFKQTHGAPEDSVRHVGDLGNIEADDKGVAKIHITDKLISVINLFVHPL